MARKLKTYVTSAGFFDLAVAAPSMKAALAAWGSRMNLFHHGLARTTDDRDIVAATMAAPGVVLRRAVGSTGPFSEHPELPGQLARTRLRKRPPERPAGDRAKQPQADDEPQADDAAARKAARAYEREQKRREAAERREAEARARRSERRDRAIAAATATLEEARRDHEARLRKIEQERAALDARSVAEDTRWKARQERLEAALRKARSQ